ncbi:MAG: SPFH domain-containing protein [Phycisphaerae bacterium]
MAQDHPHHEHVDPHHGHDNSPLEELAGVAPAEAFDAANQALVDALKLSFRVLKGVMIGAVFLYVFSGLFIVDRDKEVVVQLRFGEQINTYGEGIHWAMPYPIDELIEVPVSTDTLTLDAFWLQISDADKGKPLSELMARSDGLDPGVDGALLTGDRGIMHLLTQAQYRITDAQQYVRNVVLQGNDRTGEKDLLRAVLKNACVASAARTTAEVISKDPSTMVSGVKIRAQEMLDHLGAGITLDKVDVVQSWYPLQVQPSVDAVTNAMNTKQQAIQAAYGERQKILNEAAGRVWEDLWNAIQELDQKATDHERTEVLGRIETLLTAQASGKAGKRIQEARQQREQIVLSTLARQKAFLALLEEHRKNPELLRQRLLVEGLKDLFAQPGTVKWMLPGDENKQLDVWLNPDPVEFKKAQEAATRQRTGVGAGK